MLHSSFKRSFIGTVIALGVAAPGLAQDSRAKATAPGDVDPALAEIDAFIEASRIDRSAPNWKRKLPKPPKVTFTPGIDYFWELETNHGPIKIKLFKDEAPMHVSTTAYLSRVGFYDGLNFHRVINRFMAQGGCALGNGTAGPGFTIAGEVHPERNHDGKGVLSAANTGRGTPEGSQFFLTFIQTPHLNGVHTVYGQTVDGFATLDKLDALGTQSGRPKQPVQIVRASISVAEASESETIAEELVEEVEEVPVELAESHDSDDPAIAGVRAFIASNPIDKEKPGWRTKLPKPPEATFTEGKTYVWNVLTNKGLIRLKLLPEVAPMHVSSTTYLALHGFYDGLTFHRVIKGFMAQGGCPLGNGQGEPGYRMNLETDPKVKHDRRGLLSAANYGRDGTDGSQFYITFGPSPHLNGGYTIYGRVIEGEGEKVVDLLEQAGGGPGGKTTEPLSIVRTTISIE